jgi:hypothetical protein
MEAAGAGGNVGRLKKDTERGRKKQRGVGEQHLGVGGAARRTSSRSTAPEGGPIVYRSSYSSSVYAGDLDGVATVADAVRVPELLVEVRRAGRRGWEWKLGGATV